MAHRYQMPRKTITTPGGQTVNDFWAAVTDVLCPNPHCWDGTVRWAEDGRVPGYRICDKCGCHYMARGISTAPDLELVHDPSGRDEGSADEID